MKLAFKNIEQVDYILHDCLTEVPSLVLTVDRRITAFTNYSTSVRLLFSELTDSEKFIFSFMLELKGIERKMVKSCNRMKDSYLVAHEFRRLPNGKNLTQDVHQEILSTDRIILAYQEKFNESKDFLKNMFLSSCPIWLN